MNTENNTLTRIKKAAKSILRVDPCDITRSQYAKWQESASSTADWINTFIWENELDEDTLDDLRSMLADLREVARG